MPRPRAPARPTSTGHCRRKGWPKPRPRGAGCSSTGWCPTACSARRRGARARRWKRCSTSSATSSNASSRPSTRPRRATCWRWPRRRTRPNGCCWSATIPGWNACWRSCTAGSPAITAACRRARSRCCRCPGTRRSNRASRASPPSGGHEPLPARCRLAGRGGAACRGRVGAGDRHRCPGLARGLRTAHPLGPGAAWPLQRRRRAHRDPARRPPPGPHGTGDRRRRDRRPSRLHPLRARQRLLRRRQLADGRIRVGAVPAVAAEGGRRARRHAHHPRHLPARDLLRVAVRLRPPRHRLRRVRRPRGRPQQVRHGPLAHRDPRRGELLPAHPAGRGAGMKPGMTLAARALMVLALLAGTACATLSPEERARSAALVEAARSTELDCDRPDACARPSALHQLAARAFVESAPGAPRHYALLLDSGQDAMVARLDLIRSATTAIDLQTYIFDEDDAGQLFLDELLRAARRGVRVRLLVDQLSALKRVDTLAGLAGAHATFSIRIYNPVLDRARLSYPMYVLAAACCWNRLNRRMHSKLLLVDGAIGITGGRNYQDDYDGRETEYNVRDRDILVPGPAAGPRARDRG